MLRAQRIVLSIGLLGVAALVHGHYVTYGAAAAGHLFRIAPATEQAALAARERMKRDYSADLPLTAQELEDAAADAAESASAAASQRSSGEVTRPKRSTQAPANGCKSYDFSCYTPDWVTEEFRQRMEAEDAQRAARATERDRKVASLKAKAFEEIDGKAVYFGAFPSQAAGHSTYERGHNAFWYGIIVPAMLLLGTLTLLIARSRSSA